MFTSTIKLRFSNGIKNYSEKEIPILRYISTGYSSGQNDCQYCSDTKTVYLKNLTKEYDYVYSIKVYLQTDNWCSFGINGSWKFYNTWNSDSYNQFCNLTAEYKNENFNENTYFTMRAQDDGRNWMHLNYDLTITLKSK